MWLLVFVWTFQLSFLLFGGQVHRDRLFLSLVTLCLLVLVSIDSRPDSTRFLVDAVVKTPLLLMLEDVILTWLFRLWRRETISSDGWNAIIFVGAAAEQQTHDPPKQLESTKNVNIVGKKDSKLMKQLERERSAAERRRNEEALGRLVIGTLSAVLPVMLLRAGTWSVAGWLLLRAFEAGDNLLWELQMNKGNLAHGRWRPGYCVPVFACALHRSLSIAPVSVVLFVVAERYGFGTAISFPLFLLTSMFNFSLSVLDQRRLPNQFVLLFWLTSIIAVKFYGK